MNTSCVAVGFGEHELHGHSAECARLLRQGKRRTLSAGWDIATHLGLFSAPDSLRLHCLHKLVSHEESSGSSSLFTVKFKTRKHRSFPLSAVVVAPVLEVGDFSQWG